MLSQERGALISVIHRGAHWSADQPQTHPAFCHDSGVWEDASAFGKRKTSKKKIMTIIIISVSINWEQMPLKLCCRNSTTLTLCQCTYKIYHETISKCLIRDGTYFFFYDFNRFNRWAIHEKSLLVPLLIIYTCMQNTLDIKGGRLLSMVVKPIRLESRLWIVSTRELSTNI